MEEWQVRQAVRAVDLFQKRPAVVTPGALAVGLLGMVPAIGGMLAAPLAWMMSAHILFASGADRSGAGRRFI